MRTFKFLSIIILIHKIWITENADTYEDVMSCLEGRKQSLLLQYANVEKFFLIKSLLASPAPKIYEEPLPQLVNCDATVPKIKTECQLKAGNISVKAMGRRLDMISYNYTVNWRTAEKWCRSRGLQLLSLENTTKETEIAEILKKDGMSSNLSLWTSGTSQGQRTNFYWRTLGTNLTARVQGNSGKCLMINYNATTSKVVLQSGACDQALGFVCDVPRRCYASICYGNTGGAIAKTKGRDGKSTCPSEGTIAPKLCIKNNALFDNSTGNVIESETNGIIVKRCQKKFFISFGVAGQKESLQKCCALDMKMLSVETQEKLDCIHEMFSALPGYKNAILVDSSFSDCDKSGKSFAWCSTKTRFGPNAPWLPAAPNCDFGIEKCVVLTINPRMSGLFVGLCDKNMEPGLTMCESDLPANSTMTETQELNKALQKSYPRPHPPKNAFKSANYDKNYLFNAINDMPSCAELLKCNNTTEVPKNKSSSDTKKFNAAVRTMEICGKKLFVSKKKMFHSKGWQFCCSIGAVMATLETAEEVECVSYALREQNTGWRLYAIGSFDERFDRHFEWCKNNNSYGTLKNKTIRDELWCPFEPTNFNNNEGCVVLCSTPAGIGCLVDTSCYLAISILCEEPRKATTLRDISTTDNTVKTTTFISQSTLQKYSTQELKNTTGVVTTLSTANDTVKITTLIPQSSSMSINNSTQESRNATSTGVVATPSTTTSTVKNTTPYEKSTLMVTSMENVTSSDHLAEVEQVLMI